MTRNAPIWLYIDLLSAILAIAFTSNAAARPRKIWGYKELFAGAELVCIGTLKSTKITTNTDFLPDSLDAFESEIAIQAIFKGDPKLESATFIHYRYKPSIKTTIGNGPSFPFLLERQIATASGGQRDKTHAAHNGEASKVFLFFLKRRDSSKYGPVSGDYDAALSVALLQGNADNVDP
jgi:hypothetical protein